MSETEDEVVVSSDVGSARLYFQDVSSLSYSENVDELMDEGFLVAWEELDTVSELKWPGDIVALCIFDGEDASFNFRL